MPGARDWSGLPSSGVDQSCALCGTGVVVWVHPLDHTLVEYRERGKGHRLPSFWCTCAGCEELFLAGQDEQLIERMKASGGFRPEIAEWSADDVDEVLRKPLAVFRLASLGSVRLGDDEGDDGAAVDRMPPRPNPSPSFLVAEAAPPNQVDDQ